MKISTLKNSIEQMSANISRLKKTKNKSDKLEKRIRVAEERLEHKLALLRMRESAVEYKPVAWSEADNDYGFGDYYRYISSPEWAFRKEEYYKCHKKVCRSCGHDEKEIHLHHRTYKRIFKEDDADLAPLCKDCHASLHYLQKKLSLSVEEASKIWLSATSANPKRKKLRRFLRSRGFDDFKSALDAKFDKEESGKDNLAAAFDWMKRKTLRAKNSVVQDPEKLASDILYVKRTGDTRHYDKRVDAIIRKLEKA